MVAKSRHSLPISVLHSAPRHPSSSGYSIERSSTFRRNSANGTWTPGISKFTDPAVQLSVSQVGESLIRSCRMDVGRLNANQNSVTATCRPSVYRYRSILRLSFARYAVFDERKQDCRGTWRMLLTCIGGEAAPIWVPILLHLRLYRRTKIVGAQH